MLSETTIAILEKMEEETGKTPSALSRYRDLEKKKAGDNSSRTGRFLTTTANSALAGFGDELLDAVGAEGAADKVRSNQSRLREENPVLAVGADVTGFLAPGGAIAKGFGLGAKGISAGSRIARGASAGAVEGAAFSAGNADGQSAAERVDDALKGAAFGGAIGGAFGAGGAAIQKIVGAKPIDESGQLSKKAIDEISEAFSITREEVIASKVKNETLEQLALRTADGDVDQANQLMIPFRTGSEDVQGALGRAAERKVRDINEDIVSDSTTVVDDLTARSTADVLDSSAQREFSTANVAQRTAAGEALGEIRTSTPINNGMAVQRLITDPASGVAANKSILNAVTEAAETEISDQLQNELGETIGKLVVLTDEAAKKAKLSSGGVYVQGSKKTATGESEKIYEPAKLTIETLSTAAQNIRRKGSQQLDNSAEDASKSTGEGAKQVALSKKITEAIAEDSPELAKRNLDFIRNDAQERVNRLLGKLLKTTDEKQAPKLAQRISQVIGGNTKVAGKDLPDITPEQIMISVRAALSEAVDKNVIKSFDETSNQFKVVRELMQKSGVSNGDITRISNVIRSNIGSLATRTKVGNILDKSTDPKDVGKTLAAAFREKQTRETIISELGETGQTYIDNVERALRELEVLGKSASKSGVVEPAAKSFTKEFLKNSVWYGIIVNSPVTAAGLTLVRSLSSAGLLSKITKSKASRKAIVEYIESSPEAAALAAREELLKESSGRLVERIVRRIAIAANVSLDDDPVNKNNSTNSNQNTPSAVSGLVSNTGNTFQQLGGANNSRQQQNAAISSLGVSSGTFNGK